MKIFVPSRKYVPVSLTGSWCALRCSFCKGRFLENMVHVKPESFVNTVRNLYSFGVRGLLLSGGFRLDGTLPVEPYIDGLREVKRRFNVILSAHLGLVRSRELLAELRGIVDVVDFEFTLSRYISREVRGFSFDPMVYAESLELIVEEGLRVVPHVFIWHPGITSEDVSSELRFIEDLGLKEITLLVFIGEKSEDAADRVASQVLELAEQARSRFSGKIYMGCMRPGWIKPVLDPVLVEKDLVDRIVNPYRKALQSRLANASFYDACCSLPENLLGEFKLGNTDTYTTSSPRA